MKVIFMGTPAFALPSLRALVYNKYRVMAVVTQPDKPRGRGRNLAPTPVKEYALKQGLNCLEPDKLRDPGFLQTVRDLSPSLIVTAAYGKILPPDLLDIPPLGCINLHPSLLPLYRGAAPVQRAVMDKAGETGVTVYVMDEGMDSGDILLQEKVPLKKGETAGELMGRLAEKGASTLLKAAALLAGGKAAPRPQDHRRATYAPPIRREEELIDWFRDGEAVASHINGLSPSPGAYGFFRGRRLKVLRALPAEGSGQAGQVLGLRREGILVAAGSGAVLLCDVRPEGKKTMSAGEFIRGYRPAPGMAFDRS